MSDFHSVLHGSTNGSNGKHAAAPAYTVHRDGPLATVLQAEPAVRRHSPTLARETNRDRLTRLERVFITGVAGLVVIGWLALILAQLGRLNRTTLLLTGAAILVTTLSWTIKHLVGARQVGMKVAQRRNLLSNLPRPYPTWHILALAGLSVIAAFLYTPPADYAPAFLDAGWYTSTGALIARTGRLTTRPAGLEDLPAEDRRLFVRTYADHHASLPSFPDRDDVGFYNLTFATNLEQAGSVAPYHPPFLSVWIAILRLIGGSALGPYAAPLFGLLFALAVYAAGRALFGPNVALVGASLTALAPPVVYYARTPFAELLAGALTWAGVYALTRYATISQPKSQPSAPPHSRSPAPLHPRPPAPPLLRPSAPLLPFAGLALGAVPLVKFEGLLLLPAIAGFWALWLYRRWATRRDFIVFLIPFAALSVHAGLLYATTLWPYLALNGHGLYTLLKTALSQPSTWVALTLLYLSGIAALIFLRRRQGLGIGYWVLDIGDQRLEIRDWKSSDSRHQSPISNLHPPVPSLQSPISILHPPPSTLQSAASLLILAGAGIALLLAWPAAQDNTPAPWSGLVTLSLFLTPLGLCLGIVGLSHLVADDVSRRTAFLLMLLGTAGLTTVLLPAVSSDVSHLYTVRRQLPIVLPALLLLTGYVTLRWAGLADERRSIRESTSLRRGLVVLILALLVFNFIDAGRPLIRQRELAGSSVFVAELAQTFDPSDVVLFESVDRGAHVGRFAAPLWAEYGVNAMLLNSTYPPADQLAGVIRRWGAQGRRVYFVGETNPPQSSLPDTSWTLVEQREWAGATIAAKLVFPPESWIPQVPFYIYEAQ